MDLKMLKATPPWDWPDEARTVLLGVLRDAQASEADRLTAAELVGPTVIDDPLVDALLDLARSAAASERLRSRAAIALGPVLENLDIDIADETGYLEDPEGTLFRIQEAFEELYGDAALPKEVRRRILEASVRAPEDWHRGAVAEAYRSADRDWNLTAVFCMRYVRGFDREILESLKHKDPDIHYQAVCAAGEWSIDGAWRHVADLVRTRGTPKHLLLAAIEAVGGIRPDEASDVLGSLVEAADEDIAGAAMEAIEMARGLADSGDDDDDLDEDSDVAEDGGDLEADGDGEGEDHPDGPTGR
jgi:hypothetical protein